MVVVCEGVTRQCKSMVPGRPCEDGPFTRREVVTSEQAWRGEWFRALYQVPWFLVAGLKVRSTGYMGRLTWTL